MAGAVWRAAARAGCVAATPTPTALRPRSPGSIVQRNRGHPMAADFIEEIAQAFADRGADADGEHVSQLDHALQCAMLAEAEGACDHLIAAALLHDYGHLFEGRGDVAEREG